MSDSKQGWMRGAAVAGLVLVGGLVWQVVSLNQALTEANAAYDRLATEARAALEEERERGRQAVLDAEARGRKAADEAAASVRKSKKQGAGGKKGKKNQKERKAPAEEKVPGAAAIERIYMAAEKYAAVQEWDDATYDASSAIFDTAFGELEALSNEVSGGLSRDEARTRATAIRMTLMTGLRGLHGEDLANSILNQAKSF
ncbi:MAG: hypothetical protein ACON5B_01010 [Myxococcota bacterium]